jgi:hypothetical protein
MVRVPATLVGLFVTLLLHSATVTLAYHVQQPWLLIVLLPINAAVGGVIGGRWAMRPAPVPGFAIGLLSVAAQMGLGMSASGSILIFVMIEEVLLQIIAAITGGCSGRYWRDEPTRYLSITRRNTRRFRDAT